jgi:serine/threonine protein phosphatase PrpC
MLCPGCGLEQLGGNKFCEDCGAPLARASVAPCPRCGAGPDAVHLEGHCTRCGHQRVASGRDHLEIVLSPRLAGVSDRGKSHPCNEDFLALGSEAGGDVLVLCDGVSSSQNPGGASATAATTVRDLLLPPLCSGDPVLPGLVQEALFAAHDAVARLPWLTTLQADPPETTIVVALRQQRQVLVGWLGDSRAYLAGPHGLRPLTHDHSWINEMVDSGLMTMEEALSSSQAHCITRSLGGPVSQRDDPSLLSVDLEEHWQYLILCTDGLWNYALEAEQLANVVSRRPPGDARSLARFLVDYALDCGGRDNITVAVLDLEKRTSHR